MVNGLGRVRRAGRGYALCDHGTVLVVVLESHFYHNATETMVTLHAAMEGTYVR
jgi:hypothetical protein